MSYGSSGNDLRDIRIDTAHSEHSHGLKKRHKSSAEEHENLFTGPSSSASEVSAGRVSRASKNRKERQKVGWPETKTLSEIHLDAVCSWFTQLDHALWPQEQIADMSKTVFFDPSCVFWSSQNIALKILHGI